MNYAFFNILGRKIGINLIRPYDKTPYVKKGRKLAALTEKNYVDSYDGDIVMINLWAEFLNISTWFDWTNFENIPDNYLVCV